MNGVEFFRNFDVTAIEKNAQGNFVLKSDAGEIEAEYVVNAAGVFLRQGSFSHRRRFNNHYSP